jgi:choline dehydrogenase
MRFHPLSWPIYLLCYISARSQLGSATPASTRASSDLVYDYIVVGSGAGGGPLASRLAIAGHSVLLIESGDDQGSNSNYSVPGYQAAVTEDPKVSSLLYHASSATNYSAKMRWDIYVNHYQDQERAQRDPKYVYDVGNGERYVGLDPPAGAKPLGIW